MFLCSLYNEKKKWGGALILAVLPRDDFLFGLLVDQLTLSLS